MTRKTFTRLGFRCFRLVRSDSQLVPVQLIDTKAAMGTFLRPPPSRRARFQMRVTTMDRIIRDTLKLSA